MKRAADSHKGENGKVAVIGGSAHQHGAPLMSALAAERSGVDLLYVALPRCHAEVAKALSLNFQVYPFVGDDLSKKDIEPLLELLATMDCAVIGPGIARARASIKVLEEIIASATCRLVLDATALQPETTSLLQNKNAVLTPHLGELERMGIDVGKIGTVAKESGLTIFLKGPVDRVASSDRSVQEIHGGNAGLTVGGTGDALAGLIAGLIAQKMEMTEACMLAGNSIKKAGERLRENQGYAYSACDVIQLIPALLNELSNA